MDSRSAPSERTLLGLSPLHPHSAPYIDINRNRFKPCIYISLQKRAPQAPCFDMLANLRGGGVPPRRENLTHYNGATDMQELKLFQKTDTLHQARWWEPEPDSRVSNAVL